MQNEKDMKESHAKNHVIVKQSSFNEEDKRRARQSVTKVLMELEGVQIDLHTERALDSQEEVRGLIFFTTKTSVHSQSSSISREVESPRLETRREEEDFNLLS